MRDAWERYLGVLGPADMRRVRWTIRSMLDELQAISRRHGDDRTAALLRRDPARVQARAAAATSASASGAGVATQSKHPASASGLARPPVDEPGRQRPSPAPPPPALPSLDELAQEFPEGFHSQAELQELWVERFGRLSADSPATGKGASAAGHAGLAGATAPPGGSPDGSAQQGAQRRVGRFSGRRKDSPALLAQRRRARLVERQLDALRRLEQLAAADPQPADPIAAWLAPETCLRLACVGIRTLGELVFFMRDKGFRWHRSVPRIGQEGAARLLAWVGAHEATLGALPLSALVPRAQFNAIRAARAAAPAPVAGIVPIERLRVPSSLAGDGGVNRAPVERCRIQARDDYAAIREWLALRTEGSNTWRAYRREAERILLWSVFGIRKPLSSLTASDCVAYRRFLEAPGIEWVGRRNTERWSPQWRPLEGPLSAKSAATAETILKSMCHWLVEVRYLDSNPWVATPKPTRAPSRPDLRALSDRQWSHVDAWLATLPPCPATGRLALLMGWALATGMREAELSAACVQWLASGQDEEGHEAWSLHVLGKGAKWREIPLPGRLVERLQNSFAGKGLQADLLANPPALPLFSQLADPAKPLTKVRIYQIMKDAFERCAAHVDRVDPMAAERIRKASPHWMRHTHGRKAADAGMEPHILQQQLGHASIATTSIYTKGDISRRRKEIERVFGQ